MTNREWTIAAELPDETACLRLEEFCARLQVEQQWITELVAIGALEPRGGREPAQWSFPLTDLQRARKLARLVNELDVDPHGAAIIFDLLEERRRLVNKLRRLLA